VSAREIVMTLFTILTIIAIIGSGLTAGIFFAFSTFVMAALGRLQAEQGIAAMQSINITVINPWFFTVFFGTPAISAIPLFRWSEPGSALILVASVVLIAGSLLVTMVFNVPLNNALARVTLTNSEGASLWTRYLSEWTQWNHVRTIAPLVAMVLYIWAVVQRSAM
jgi:uncharacterized membrane protein